MKGRIEGRKKVKTWLIDDNDEKLDLNDTSEPSKPH